MFGIFDLIFLTANLVASITVTSVDMITLPTQRESAIAVSFKREWWRDDGSGKCTFDGILVPVVQDWDEVVTEGDNERVIKANPYTTIGHVVILNRKICKGKEPEAIMRGAVHSRVNGYLFPADPVHAGDLLQSRPGEVPKWFGQIVARIERVAANDRNAENFLNASRKELVEVSALLTPKNVQEKNAENRTLSHN